MITLEQVKELQECLQDLSEPENRAEALKQVTTMVDDLSWQKRLEERAADYEQLPEYVGHLIAEGHPDELWVVLERVLDDLDRGMSDTLEEFADWKREQEENAVRERRRRFDLWSAADQWNDHMKEQLLSPHQHTRGHLARTQKEQERLQGSLDEEWELIK